MLNYLRNKDNGCFFLKDGLEKIIDLDNRIYYSFIDFASLVELMINQEYILLRPYGRFDDSKFYLEIYQKRIDFAN